MPCMWLSYKKGAVEWKRRGETSGFNSANKQILVLALFVTIIFAVVNLCQKTHKRVSGRSSGPSKKMASRLLEQ